MKRLTLGFAVLVVLGVWPMIGQAVTIETVPLGNPGNAGEWSGQSYGGYGPDRICGAVGYTYNIGKYEVTAGQYTPFLSAVAKTDTCGLYSTSMWISPFGCKIQRSRSWGKYTYSVASDYANRPVNLVSCWDASPFANWLHNAQPTGAQGAGTTETGAYTLTSDGMSNNTIVRNTNWKWGVTSEDEWYKAAYYKSGGTNAGYWDYPTSSDTAPGQDMADASGNSANYYTAPYAYPIDSGKYTTLGGEFQNSDSPYGTFDQGRNVWEWNEAILYGSSRGLRRGSFLIYPGSLLPSHRRNAHFPSGENYFIGLRVASVPDPGSIILLGVGTLALLAYGGRRRRGGEVVAGTGPLSTIHDRRKTT